jgi:hypothetical protein
VPVVDRHDHIFLGEGRRAALFGVLVGFQASGEGSRGHKILHHAAVPELALDGVGVVWTRLLQELLEVARGWPPLMLAAACSSRDMCHVGAIRSLVVATIVVSRGCSLLKSLLAPLPTALGALLGILGGDSSRCPLLLLEAG